MLPSPEKIHSACNFCNKYAIFMHSTCFLWPQNLRAENSTKKILTPKDQQL